MVEGGIIVKATNNNSTKPLLPSRASYARSLFYADNELKNFLSYLR